MAAVDTGRGQAAAMTVDKRGRRMAPYALSGPAIIFVSVFLMLPLLMMLRLSFYRYDSAQMYIEAFTLENYVRFFPPENFLRFLKDYFYRQVLWTALWISAPTPLLCLIGGGAVAYFMART